LRSKLVIIGSYSLSLCILAWAVWLPWQALRSPELTQPVTPVHAVAKQVQSRQSRAQIVRADALEKDAQLMETLRQQTQSRIAGKPTSVESRMWLDQRISEIKRQIRDLGSPPTGTVEWEYQQRLTSYLEDTPQ
jgi:hypothetical protein